MHTSCWSISDTVMCTLIAVILVAHVAGNVVAASYLLPESETIPSLDRFTATPTRAARAILMSPVLEELIFRGLMSCVIYNRCRDPKPGCAASCTKLPHSSDYTERRRMVHIAVLPTRCSPLST